MTSASQFFNRRDSQAIIRNEYRLFKQWLREDPHRVPNQDYTYRLSQRLNYYEKYLLGLVINKLSDARVTIKVGISRNNNELLISPVDTANLSIVSPNSKYLFYDIDLVEVYDVDET